MHFKTYNEEIYRRRTEARKILVTTLCAYIEAQENNKGPMGEGDWGRVRKSYKNYMKTFEEEQHNAETIVDYLVEHGISLNVIANYGIHAPDLSRVATKRLFGK